MSAMDRRRFLETAGLLSLAASAAREARAGGPTAGIAEKGSADHHAPHGAVLPRSLPHGARRRLRGDRDADRRAIPREAEEIRAASASTGLRIHSVMNSDHWKFPLSSADPEVVRKSVAGMETSFRNAKLWGADTVLLVPAVVDPQTSYRTRGRGPRRSSASACCPWPAT